MENKIKIGCKINCTIGLFPMKWEILLKIFRKNGGSTNREMLKQKRIKKNRNSHRILTKEELNSLNII